MATSNSTKRNNLLLSLSDPKKDNVFTPFASIFKVQMFHSSDLESRRFLVDIITNPSEGHAPLYFHAGSSTRAAVNAKISGWDLLNLDPSATLNTVIKNLQTT